MRAWALVNPDNTIATGPSYDRQLDTLQIFPTKGVAMDVSQVRRVLCEVYTIPREPYLETVKGVTITID